ncbi:MAG: AbrB/MazE/SpoVT family DNA-binding domain-containing protein [Armatimonadetes bacterium]|nr:AbrB/MazE/SpoVT family DNA-binding domain-containing protein [Armatimonadota bacterium]
MDDSFYGTATVGERGQLVIPAEARSELGIKAGDKLLIMRHPMYKGLMVVKIDALEGFLDEFSKSLERLRGDQAAESEEE